MPDATAVSTWWRWLAMPPAAILGAAAGGALMHAFQWLSLMLNWGSSEGWYYRYAVPILVSGAAGYAYATTACWVAPRGKRLAGTVMVTLLGVLCLVGAVAGWIMPRYTTGQAVLSTLSAIAMMFTAVAVVANEKA